MIFTDFLLLKFFPMIPSLFSCNWQYKAKYFVSAEGAGFGGWGGKGGNNDRGNITPIVELVLEDGMPKNNYMMSNLVNSHV